MSSGNDDAEGLDNGPTESNPAWDSAYCRERVLVAYLFTNSGTPQMELERMGKSAARAGFQERVNFNHQIKPAARRACHDQTLKDKREKRRRTNPHFILDSASERSLRCVCVCTFIPFMSREPWDKDAQMVGCGQLLLFGCRSEGRISFSSPLMTPAILWTF